MTRIAIDAMGGDHAPHEIVAGAVWAAKEYGVAIELVGKQDRIEQELDKISQEGFMTDNGKGGAAKYRVKIDTSKLDIKITHASEVIEMGEAPGQAIRKKKKSSIVLAVDAVAQGSSDAVVAAGSTGAAMASSLFGLGRIPGIDRPAIAAFMPTSIPNQDVVMLDMGANAECNATNLVEFAIMGSVYYRILYGVKQPSVGLLNIGSEETKGREEIREAAYILRENKRKVNYVGFVEGNDIGAGTSHVVVSDGFSGNVALKSIEGTARLIKTATKDIVKHSLLAKIGFIFMIPALLKIKKRMDPRRYNGAMFLGLNGVSVKSHGGADAIGYCYALENAISLAQHDLCEKIKQELEDIILSPETDSE